MARVHPIQRWLKDHNSKQRSLAEQAGIEASSLSRHLSGKQRLSVESAEAVREVTGLSLDQIFARVGVGR
jgi:transcriptional regulator with XRE-family HTH domain